jgi:hypothetical protein
MISQAQPLVRDKHSNAVLNTDVAALNKYKKERALYRQVDSLSKELESVKQCLSDVSARLDKIESN